MFSLLLSLAIYEPIQLTDRNFRSKTKDVPLMFMMASRSDVGFCQDVLPKFRAVAEMLKDKVQFAILEANTSEKIRTENGIFAYPSFFVLRNGKVTCEYPGEREASSMFKYLSRVIGPAVIEIDNARDMNDFLEEYPTCVILAGDDEMLPQFKEVAEMNTDAVPFVHATSDAIQQLGYEEVPALWMYRHQDRAEMEFPLAFGIRTSTLDECVKKNLKPRYRERDSLSFRDAIYDSRHTILAFVDTTKKSSMDLMHSTMSHLVDEYGENFTYIYSDIYDMGHVVLSLGFTGTREPIWCIGNIQQNDITDKAIFSERKEATPENVAKWVSDFISGKVKGSARSEPVPGDNDNAPLRKLVGSQFRRVTQERKHDLVIMMLVGDDNEKQRGISLVNEVAEEFSRQKVETVDFYYIDVDKNDMPGLKVPKLSGPSMLIWTAESGSQPMMIPSESGATPSQIMNVIVTHAYTKPKFSAPAEFDEGDLEL